MYFFFQSAKMADSPITAEELAGVKKTWAMVEKDLDMHGVAILQA